MAEKLNTISVKEFMISAGFVEIVKTVRVNQNGYPYVTFITTSNEAENIYFSRNAAKLVDEGSVIEKGFFNPFRIAEVTNNAGEKRIKLVGMGESLRTSIEDLF